MIFESCQLNKHFIFFPLINLFADKIFEKAKLRKLFTEVNRNDADSREISIVSIERKANTNNDARSGVLKVAIYDDARQPQLKQNPPKTLKCLMPSRRKRAR